MKIVENFVVGINKLKYVSFENTSKYKKDDEGNTNYICNAIVYEIGRGMAKFKTYHNIVFYLTKEQFENKVIEKGDRINILAGAKWKSSPLTYKSYGEETIKNADRSQLKVDSNGKTYFESFAYAYKVVCKDGQWSINTKWDEANYCTISYSSIKLPLEDKQSFSNPSLDYFLDENEFDKLKDLNGQVVKLVAYSFKNKFGEKTALVSASYNEDNGTYYLLLEEKGADE